MEQYQIIKTEDGSCTLHHAQNDTTFHSIYGAVTESKHVFIEAGLQHLFGNNTTVNILEIGFGTGLNALLAFLYARDHHVFVNYTSVDPNSLPYDLVCQLGYPNYLKEPGVSGIFEAMHNVGDRQQMSTYFSLQRYSGTLEDLNISRQFNLIFYDAFDAAVQPEMWTSSALRKIADVTLPGGVVVTYCAKGQFKRDLKALGFDIESLPGPPGKREMVRAIISPHHLE